MVRGIFSNNKRSNRTSTCMSPAEVIDLYSMNYPELTTATVHGPEIEDDRAVYEFKTTIGVKG